MSEFLRRRTLLAGFAASAITFFFPAIAQAASPLIKPAKIGQKVIFQGYTYTVVKSKGKLIWRKGAKYIPATPTPSATASATPTPTPSATPTPTASSAPISKGVVIAQSSQILEGKTKIVDAKDNDGRNQKFAISRFSGKVKVFSNICTHAGCPLAVSGANLGCDCHGSEFSGFDGAVIMGPAMVALTVYRSLEENGTIILLK